MLVDAFRRCQRRVRPFTRAREGLQPWARATVQSFRARRGFDSLFEATVQSPVLARRCWPEGALMTRWGVAAALTTLTAGLLAAPAARAQAIQNVVLRNSFNPLGAGARGLGMGGAFTAVADDGTAASFNPAGLTQLRRTELALVGFTDLLESDVTVPKASGPVTTDTSARHQRPDFAGLALPFEVGGHSLTIQISYQRAVDLFGHGVATVQDTVALSALDPTLKGNGDIIADLAPDQSGAFHTLSMVGGYQLTPRLSIGTSINYWIAQWTAQGTGSFRLRVKPAGGGRVVETPLFD